LNLFQLFFPNFGIFLYLICHDFRKINGRIKIFEKCTSGASPAAAPCGVKSLPLRGTAAGARFQRQGGAARCQGLFYFFSFSFLKNF
jgi:hypothetical protein